jgi:hypothetical protein
MPLADAALLEFSLDACCQRMKSVKDDKVFLDGEKGMSTSRHDWRATQKRGVLNLLRSSQRFI